MNQSDKRRMMDKAHAIGRAKDTEAKRLAVIAWCRAAKMALR